VKQIVLLLIPGVFFYNFYLITGHYFSGKGKYHINTVASAIGLIVTLVLSLILIPKYDFYGAAMAGTASFIATSAYAFWVFRRISGFPLSEFFPGKGDITEYIRFFKKTSDRDG
jgi:O-antigen/teichoic acid export membrane protein